MEEPNVTATRAGWMQDAAAGRLFTGLHGGSAT